MFGLLAELGGETLSMPVQNSTYAGFVDTAYNWIYYLCVVFFLGINGLMAYFVWRYHRKSPHELGSGPTHNTMLEVTWSVIPFLLVIIMFGYGFRGYADITRPPSEGYEIDVLGKTWAWEFTYPDGTVTSELHVPVGNPVILTMTSNDVIHSLFLPVCRAKKDVVPGRYHKMWFETLGPGDFDLFCTEYCGTGHSDMITRFIVHPIDEPFDMGEGKDPLLPFDEWLVVASDIEKNPEFLDEEGNYLPAKAGASLYEKRGCVQCHSIDGSRKVGPSFKGSFGTMIEIEGQSEQVPMDENYIRESIIKPMEKIHKGYPAKMPSYAGSLKTKEINALIAFIKSLKE